MKTRLTIGGEFRNCQRLATARGELCEVRFHYPSSFDCDEQEVRNRVNGSRLVEFDRAEFQVLIDGVVGTCLRILPQSPSSTAVETYMETKTETAPESPRESERETRNATVTGMGTSTGTTAESALESQADSVPETLGGSRTPTMAESVLGPIVVNVPNQSAANPDSSKRSVLGLAIGGVMGLLGLLLLLLFALKRRRGSGDSDVIEKIIEEDSVAWFLEDPGYATQQSPLDLVRTTEDHGDMADDEDLYEDQRELLSPYLDFGPPM